MAYTVRTTEAEEEIIQKAKNVLGEKSTTKTMILSMEKLPEHVRKIADLEKRLEKSRDEYRSLIYLLREQRQTAVEIDSIVDKG